MHTDSSRTGTASPARHPAPRRNPPRPRRAAWRDLRIGRSGIEEFAALAALGIFLAAVSAFDDLGSFGLRLVYWQICIVGGGVVAAVIEPPLRALTGPRMSPLLQAATQAFVMTFPIALLVWLVSAVMIGSPLTPAWLLHFFGAALPVSFLVVGLAVLLRRATRSTPKAVPRPTNPLSNHLPPLLARAPLIAIRAEDHYLRVHTTEGQQLVLMKFSDALARLAEADGLQTHRSWWVARSAVASIRWRAARGEIMLTNGLSVPVSRTYARSVRNTSWG